MKNIHVLAAALLCGPCLMTQAPIFTDTFESGKIDAAKCDRRVAGAAAIAVEPADGAHGKYALHAHYPEGRETATRSSSPPTFRIPSARTCSAALI